MKWRIAWLDISKNILKYIQYCQNNKHSNQNVHHIVLELYKNNN